MNKKPLVSIICLSYNHEKYVNQTLMSILNQETDFFYEIIVHDDASIDNTQSILKSYKEKYPGIIRLILQKENQYSKGKDIINEFLVPMAQGKYVAICECDDFWCDNRKLQKQVDILERETDCSASISRVDCVNEQGNQIDDFFPRSRFLKQGKIKSDTFIPLVLNTESLSLLQFQLSGLMVRKSVLNQYSKENPLYKQIMDVGDIPLFLYCGLSGNVYYLNDTMSCYRIGAIGSWNQNHSGTQKKIIHLEKEISGLNEFNKYTNFQFAEDVNLAIKKRNFIKLELQKRYRKLLNRDMKEVFKILSKKKKIKIIFKGIFNS